jgi:hypothetical protein
LQRSPIVGAQQGVELLRKKLEVALHLRGVPERNPELLGRTGPRVWRQACSPYLLLLSENPIAPKTH